MRLDQYYLDCLSQASYLIGDETSGLAAVVDPRRDVEEYLRDAAAAGMRIAYVIETHLHGDFLSGHLELAEATGAEIVYGAAAETEFPVRHVDDGERLSLGEVTLELRATPGHTPESISVVVWDHPAAPTPRAVLTGDTLFIGDVGRPDLLSAKGMTAEQMAGRLYDSLHTKLLTLPDDTLVYPAHGAGSACGKNLSTDTVSTIGEQRRTNYAVQPMSREQFIACVTDGQATAPGYFAYDAGANARRHDLLADQPVTALKLEQVLAQQRGGVVVLDVRPADAFASGHLRGSINVGLDGRFAEYAGTIISPERHVIVVAGDPFSAREARTRLARIGFDRVIGALLDPDVVLVHRPEVAARASRVTAQQLADLIAGPGDLQLIDVRTRGEQQTGTIPGAVSIPLTELRERVDELDFRRPIVVHCAGGYRSCLAASWLRAEGAQDVSDLLGGYTAWAGQPAG
jgi:hydroxyacylglutathione hydrolase